MTRPASGVTPSIDSDGRRWYILWATRSRPGTKDLRHTRSDEAA